MTGTPTALSRWMTRSARIQWRRTSTRGERRHSASARTAGQSERRSRPASPRGTEEDLIVGVTLVSQARRRT
eukprot:1196419-Prorocentrum_minimum.AAC.4